MGELTPPDLKRCQADRPNGHSFMTLGGRPGLERCTSKPTKLVTENAPGEDGQIGRMTLCEHCFSVFQKKMPADYATATDLEKFDG